MSGGTAPHQLKYYEEMSGRVAEAKRIVDERHPGVAEAIFATAVAETQRVIAQRISDLPIDNDGTSETLDNMRSDSWGAMHELLLEVEGGGTSAAEIAVAKAKDLGVEDPELLEVIRKAADAQCDLIVTMERDHWDAE